MKKYGKYLIAAVAGLVFFAACDNYEADDHKFGNAVYLDVAETNEVQLTTFGNNKPTYDCALQAELTYPAGQDVAVTLTVDPSLVGTYNARYGTEWTMLDAKYYELSAESVTIAAGKTTSDVVTLQFKELMGQGEEQTGALPIDETYLVPVRIGHASMDVLHGSDVAYYVVKRSSAITVAAQLTDNWIEFPTLDKYSESSKAWNGLTAVTYEALIYLDDFATSNATGSPVNISSIMGVEQYLLLRIGDTNFERQQLQFDGSGAGSSFGKIPGRTSKRGAGTMSPAHMTKRRVPHASMSMARFRAKRPMSASRRRARRTRSIWPCGRSTTCGIRLPTTKNRSTRPTTRVTTSWARLTSSSSAAPTTITVL